MEGTGKRYHPHQLLIFTPFGPPKSAPVLPHPRMPLEFYPMHCGFLEFWGPGLWAKFFYTKECQEVGIPGSCPNPNSFCSARVHRPAALLRPIGWTAVDTAGLGTHTNLRGVSPWQGEVLHPSYGDPSAGIDVLPHSLGYVTMALPRSTLLS